MQYAYNPLVEDFTEVFPMIHKGYVPFDPCMKNFRKTAAVYSENHRQHTNTFFAQNEYFWYIKAEVQKCNIPTS
jgi:hypothetical protein